MNKLEKLLRKDEKTIHPLIEHVRDEDPDNIRMDILRPEDIIGYKPEKIQIKIKGKTLESSSWDDQLNQELIDLGIRAISEDKEKIRFYLFLRWKFKPAERHYGEGYFNAVLRKQILEEFVGDSEELQDIMKDVFTHEPSQEGTSYDECVNAIELALADAAKDLVNKLHYELPNAMIILTGALAHYLDERFSVTSRRRLGWT